MLINLIKKHIDQKPRNCHEILNQVIRAYWNTPKGATFTTHFKLVYGQDVVLPFELNLQSLRLQRQNDLHGQDYWNMMYDQLNNQVKNECWLWTILFDKKKEWTDVMTRKSRRKTSK
jgi:hypothetical protein